METTDPHRGHQHGFRQCNERNQALVVALSPSTDRLPVDAGRTLLGDACEAAMWDVLRIARSRRWCKLTAGEELSNAELGIRRAS